ncbi:MAG: phosphoglycerate transporter [Chloroflexi bacterium]|nr:phosphoglycerate transporter [Chloroflexota bacterium]
MFGIGWFSTGRDKAARDLLATVQDNIKKGEIEALITFVFSNRETGESPESDRLFELVKSFHLPLVCFSSRRFQEACRKPLDACRLEYDREVIKRTALFHQDLIVLAGYMLIAGPEICRRYNMINLHPAAPGGPTGSWQDVIWKLLETRATSTGVMMHLVTPELDRGPVVTYCAFSINSAKFQAGWRELDKYGVAETKQRQGENNALFRLIRQEGLDREFPLIVATIKAFAAGRVRIQAGKVVDSRGQPVNGYDLTEEIETKLDTQIPNTNL